MNESAIKGIVGKAMDLLKFSEKEINNASSKAAYKFNAKSNRLVNEAVKDKSKAKEIFNNAKVAYKKTADEIAKGGTNGVREEVFQAREQIKKMGGNLDDVYSKEAKNVAMGGYKRAAADGVNMADTAAYQKYIKDNITGFQSEINRTATFEKVKGYFSQPFKNMKDKNLTSTERDFAQKQFIARAGAVGAVGVAGAGLTHDLLSNNEEDIGTNNITTDAVTTGGLAAAGALGVSMLTKL